jgi:hypothetical protein
MYKIIFDDWLNCFTGSSFQIEMLCVPRIGEKIAFHKSSLPEHYQDGDMYEDMDIKFDHAGMLEFDVVDIKHSIKDGQHIIDACIELNDIAQQVG